MHTSMFLLSEAMLTKLAFILAFPTMWPLVSIEPGLQYEYRMRSWQQGIHTRELGLALKQHLSIRSLRIERLVNCQQLRAQCEQRTTLRVGKLLAVWQGEGVSTTLQNFNAGLVGDVESVTGEGPDLFLHAKDGLIWHAVGGIDAKRRRDGVELGRCRWHVGGLWLCLCWITKRLFVVCMVKLSWVPRSYVVGTRGRGIKVRGRIEGALELIYICR